MICRCSNNRHELNYYNSEVELDVLEWNGFLRIKYQNTQFSNGVNQAKMAMHSKIPDMQIFRSFASKYQWEINQSSLERYTCVLFYAQLNVHIKHVISYIFCHFKHPLLAPYTVFEWRTGKKTNWRTQIDIHFNKWSFVLANIYRCIFRMCIFMVKSWIECVMCGLIEAFKSNEHSLAA